MSNSNQIQFPPPNSPLVDPTSGIINQQWMYFLIQLFNRVGGASGVPSGGGATPTSPLISVTAFGAVGDGSTDDTLAFQAAFASTNSVYVPPGEYKISSPIILKNNQSLIGAGQSAYIIQTNSGADVIQIQGEYNAVQSLKLQGGYAGIRLFGASGPCVANTVTDIAMFGQEFGIILDGFQSTSNPCYWNNFYRVVVDGPKIHGVWLMVSGAGDTPNANKFHSVRVYSHGNPMSGSGFYVQAGRFQNSFVDCEANLWPAATSCYRLGPNANKNEFINPVAESLGPLPGFYLELGSQDTAIYNFEGQSAGAAIYDLSGGQYQSFNSGFPIKNTLSKTVIIDGQLNLQRFNVPFVQGFSQYNIDGTQSYYLLSAFSGNLIVNLPAASTVAGMKLYLKRGDNTTNTITVLENNGAGAGPDGLGFVYMNNQNDWLEMTTNGSTWQINSTNMPLVQNTFVTGLTTFTADLTKQIYLVSAFSGNVAFTLPNAHQPNSAGKEVIIKKIDNSSGTVTIAEGNYLTNTGTGPDGGTITLSNEYDFIRCYCNGAGWFVTAGNILTKLGIQTSPQFNLDVFSGGSPSTAEQAQIARFGGGSSPTAANMYMIGLAKAGTDELYMGINKNSITGNVPANAVVISSFGAGSTIVLGRGNSGSNIDYADIMITGTAGQGIVTANGVETIIGVLKGANFNTTSDQGITITTANSLKYVVTKILVGNSSISLSTAAGGIYTGTSKSGLAIVTSAQTYTGVSGSTVIVPLTLNTTATRTIITNSPIYLSLTTAQGAAATADVYIFGIPLV